MESVFIAGPCVIESADVLSEVAQELVRLRGQYGITIYFKASFDKANRTSICSYRGPGLPLGLQMLADVKEKYELARRVVLLYNYTPAIVKAFVQTKRRSLDLDRNSTKFGKQ